MPTTAYSKYFARELDVEQLASLLRETQPAGQPDHDMDSQWRDWIRSDIQCSSCGKSGAQIVRSAKAHGTQKAIRQSHFRFVGQGGSDAHHPFCEFYGDDGAEVRLVDSLVDFGVARTAETRQIRELVCKGIEQNVFTQSAIRDMRQWFFDLKVSSRFTVTTSPEAIDWFSCLRHHPSYRRWSFHPVQAEMPGYDWKQAAIYQFTEENGALLELLRGAPHDDSYVSKAGELAAKYQGQQMFSVTTLKPYYDAALMLCTFIAANAGMDFGKTRPDYYQFKGAPVRLLALCALLLFISNWDMNDAIAKFAKIFAAPPPSDTSLGNVVGLNPFHDYTAWRVVIIAGDAAARSSNGFDYPGQLAVIQERLREQHRLWKLGNP